MIVQDLIDILKCKYRKDIDSISYGLDMSGRIYTIILVPDKD